MPGKRQYPDFNSQLALGLIPNLQEFRKFGANEITAGDGSREDIWRCGAAGDSVKVMPVTAGTVSISSTSAEDDPDDGVDAGTGAWSIVIQGLDSNYNRQQETIELNGTAAVTSTLSYIHVDRAYVVECGSTGSNVGIITGVIGANDQFFITPADGQTQQMQYIVPAGYTLSLNSYHIGVGRMSGNVDLSIKFQINLYDSTANNNYQGWRTVSDMFLFNGENIAYERGEVVLPEKCMFRCQVESSVSTQVYAEVSGFLIDSDLLSRM